jgi:ankyrin repeat protein
MFILKSIHIKIDDTDIYGNNCLYYATLYRHREIVKILTRLNIIYSKDNNNKTCLHIATSKGFCELVDYYLSGKYVKNP